MSGGFTRVGALLWEWEPFMSLNNDGRILWLALFTSPTAKRQIPGLWHGSLQVMSDSSRMPLQDTWAALDTMLVRGIVEFDESHRVLRLCELPDAGEWPSGPFMLKTWWNRFQMIPACAVRDAHVTTLRWLLDRGALEAALNPDNKRHSGRPSPKHEECWQDTFAKVQIPVPRHRGKRRMDEMEPGVFAQPGLFDANRGATPGSDLDPHLSKEIEDQGGCHPRGTGEGEGVGEGVSSLLLGEESRSGASGGGDLVRPHLALVPPVHPYDDLLAGIAEATNGRYQPVARQGLHEALCRTKAALDANGVGGRDLAVVGQWIARATVGIGPIPGDPLTRLSVWVAAPGNVLAALKAAGDHEREEADALASLAELKKQLGY